MIYLVAVILLILGFLLGVSLSNILRKKAPKFHNRICIGCGVLPDDGEGN